MTSGTRETFTLERTYEAPIEDVWALWTTTDGIESWWGPDGFRVTVQHLDLRPGGRLRYVMTATAPEQVEFMNAAGMPGTMELAITYTEVSAPVRLRYTNHVDFVPGHGAYDVGTLVELQAIDGLVRMVVTIDAMHDDEWTQRAAMGWDSELGKLDRILAERRAPGRTADPHQSSTQLGKD